MNLNTNQFMLYHSEVIECCQTIEYDLKVIFAYMRKGNPSENFAELNKTTLGSIIQRLKKLDESDGKPYFSKNDYDFLNKLTAKRNYWCHQCYLDFVYIDNYLYSKEYSDVCSKLTDDYNQFRNVRKNVESVRLELVNRYKRVK